ncbi:MAG: serine/threonine protein kinase [Myxococcales bacterium]|nr:serine/threonine protein kinase [Myxococcales bacterium]
MSQDSRPVRVPSHDQALVGKTLQGYLLEKQVGRGGMAWIYRAHQLSTEAYVAIKILFPHLVEMPEFRRRFLEEAYIQYELEHPSIVQVLDAINEPPFFGTVLEWANLRDLKFWLKRSQRPLDFQGIWSLMMPLLDGLGLAHQQGVIHRDLKPDNILFHFDGRHVLPKLGDFGVAKLLNEANSNTVTGSVLGTPKYMSPEQIVDSKKVDQRSDVYSLGILIYRLATGILPFRQKSALALMRQHESEPPPLPSSINSSISPMLETVILRCLEKRPANRYPSCQALQEALGALPGIDTQDRESFRRQLGVPELLTPSFIEELAELSAGGASSPSQDSNAKPKPQSSKPSQAPMWSDANVSGSFSQSAAPALSSIEVRELPGGKDGGMGGGNVSLADSLLDLEPIPRFTAMVPKSDNFLRILAEQAPSHQAGKQPSGGALSQDGIRTLEIDKSLLPDAMDMEFGKTVPEGSELSKKIAEAFSTPASGMPNSPMGRNELNTTIPEHLFTNKQGVSLDHARALQDELGPPLSDPALSLTMDAPSRDELSAVDLSKGRHALPAFAPSKQAASNEPYQKILPDLLLAKTNVPTRPKMVKGLMKEGAHEPERGKSGLFILAGVLVVAVASLSIMFLGPAKNKEHRPAVRQSTKDAFLEKLQTQINQGDRAWKEKRYRAAASAWVKVSQIKGWEKTKYYPKLFEAISGALLKMRQFDASLRYFQLYVKALSPKDPSQGRQKHVAALQKKQKDAAKISTEAFASLKKAMEQKDLEAALPFFRKIGQEGEISASVYLPLLKLLSDAFPQMTVFLYQRLSFYLDLTPTEQKSWKELGQQLKQQLAKAKQTVDARLDQLFEKTRRASESSTHRAVQEVLKEQGNMPLLHFRFFAKRQVLARKQLRQASKLYKAHKSALNEGMRTLLHTWYGAFVGIGEDISTSHQGAPVSHVPVTVWESKQFEQEGEKLEQRKKMFSSLELSKRYLLRKRLFRAQESWSNLPKHWKTFLLEQGEEKRVLSALEQMDRIYQELRQVRTMLADALPTKAQQQVLLLMDDMNGRREKLLPWLNAKEYQGLLDGLKMLLQRCSVGQQLIQNAQEAFARKEWKEAEQGYKKYLQEMPRKNGKNWLHERIHACRCALGAGWASCKKSNP